MPPIRAFDNFVDARAQAHAPDPKIVRGDGIWLNEMSFAHLGRIEIEFFRDLVEMNFERVARLGRAVSSLRPARRFVGENARAGELVTRHCISDRLQSTGTKTS